MIGIILVNRNKGIEDEKLSVKKEYQTSDNQFILKIISRDDEKIYNLKTNEFISKKSWFFPY